MEYSSKVRADFNKVERLLATSQTCYGKPPVPENWASEDRGGLDTQVLLSAEELERPVRRNFLNFLELRFNCSGEFNFMYPQPASPRDSPYANGLNLSLLVDNPCIWRQIQTRRRQWRLEHLTLATAILDYMAYIKVAIVAL